MCTDNERSNRRKRCLRCLLFFTTIQFICVCVDNEPLIHFLRTVLRADLSTLCRTKDDGTDASEDRQAPPTHARTEEGSYVCLLYVGSELRIITVMSINVRITNNYEKKRHFSHSSVLPERKDNKGWCTSYCSHRSNRTVPLATRDCLEDDTIGGDDGDAPLYGFYCRLLRRSWSIDRKDH